MWPDLGASSGIGSFFPPHVGAWPLLSHLEWPGRVSREVWVWDLATGVPQVRAWPLRVYKVYKVHKGSIPAS